MTISPRCPYCKVAGDKFLGTRYYEEFVLVCCNRCGHIHGVLPVNPASKIPNPEPPPPPRRVAAKVPPSPRPIDELGNADLSDKIPYSVQDMAARMRAADQGTRYLQIAMEDGPPVCPDHKIEMKKIVVPDGYPNTGRKMWVCPKYRECKAWELAE